MSEATGPAAIKAIYEAAAPGTSHIMVTADDGNLWLACFAEGYSEMGDLIVQVEQGDSWHVLSGMVAAHLAEHGCAEADAPDADVAARLSEGAKA